MSDLFNSRLGSSFRQALRRFARSPALSTAALLAVALGIGASTAILSVVEATRHRPLAFDDPSALVSVWIESAREADAGRTGLTAADLGDLRAEPGLFAALAGWRAADPLYTDVAASEAVLGAEVTAGMFSRVLRVRPLLGRAFLPEEDEPGAGPTVLLAHRFWTEHFGDDAGVIGRSIDLDGVPHVVVGVMPASFKPPFRPEADLWTPARLERERCRRRCPAVEAIGRLATGTALPVARDRAEAVGARLAESYPETNRGVALRVASLQSEEGTLSADTVQLLLSLGGLVLLIACANVGLLLMAGGLDRAREMKIRRSVGAGDGALVRQLLTESLILSALGGAAGVGLAVWGLEALIQAAPPGLFASERPRLEGGVLVATTLLVAMTGLLSGTAPSVFAVRWTRFGFGRPGGGGPKRRAGPAARLGGSARGALGALQVAVATAMVVAAGALLQGLHDATTESLGFEPEGLLTLRVDLPVDGLGRARARSELVREIEDRLSELPGAFAVGTAGSVPFDGGLPSPVALTTEDQEGDGPEPPATVRVRAVSPAYFYTLEQRLADGRWFHHDDDAEGRPVAILNATATRRLAPDPAWSPLGVEVRIGDEATWRTVVGLVEDEWADSDVRRAEPVAYVPLAQAPPERLVFALRVDGDPLAVVPAAREALAEVDPSLRSALMEPMARRVEAAYAAERFATLLATMLATLALLMSAVGLMGILAHGVMSRLSELGLRRALGASDDDLRRRVLGRAALVTGLGMLGAGVGAQVVAEGIDAAVTGIAVQTPVVYALAVTSMALAALMASSWPVRRTLSADPVSALRVD